MPFIRVSLMEGRTQEQKTELAKKITDAVVETFQVKPEYVWIVYDERPKNQWSIGGDMAS